MTIIIDNEKDGESGKYEGFMLIDDQDIVNDVIEIH
jgi:hypothetical protein